MLHQSRRSAPLWITLTLGVCLAAGGCWDASTSPEAGSADLDTASAEPRPAIDTTLNTTDMNPGLIHQVYFWLDPALDEAARQDFVAGMKSLSAAPTVRRVMVGPPAATPQRDVTDKTFDYMLVLWFDDVAGHDAYQIDPVHLAFVKAHEAKFKTVKVLDAEVL